MIGFLRGQILDSADGVIIIDVGGVGYEVETGANLASRLLPAPEENSLHIETVVREDSIRLFGFADSTHKRLFQLFTSISGLGPKTSLILVDTLGSGQIVSAVRNGDWALFKSVPGIGEKTARKIVLEAESKVKKSDWLASTPVVATPSNTNSALFDDLVSALVNLGFPKAQVEKELRASWTENADFETLFRLMAAKFSSAFKDR